MRRARLLLMLVGVLAAFACLPGAAAAANFTWDVTSDFSTSPFSNPDHDHYGGTPWSYEEGGGTLLSTSDPSINGSLAGWKDPSGTPFVAVPNPQDKVVLQPSTSAPAVIAWTSPVSGTIDVSGSVVADQPSNVALLCPNASWALLQDGNATGVGQGASATPTQYDTQLSVTAGQRITLEVSVPQLPLVTPDCAQTSATLTITEVAAAPTVTLASPANGATITDGQPTFSGTADTAFGASSTVTVRVFGGTGTTGTPIQTLATTASGGRYSVAPSSPLPVGTYTAQAEQDSVAGPQGFSSANTFTLKTTPATVTLNSPGTAPLGTSTPTLTGVAAHSQAVTITAYPGTSTNSTPVGTASGTSGADGRFSIQLPTLPDGQYTVIASDGADGRSAPLTFRIKVYAPALTLTQPMDGGYLSQGGPMFIGAAGDSLGDAQQVSVTLYGGSSPAAQNLGTQRATQAGGSWTLAWPLRLALGTYTVRVSQSDDAGHTTTVTHTFRIVAANSSVGASVEISPTGQVSVPMWCTAPVGRSCSGTVLILTKKTYRAAGGGLAGRLRVMFAYVTIPGGGSIVVSRQVQSDALRTLRRARTVPVVVVAALKSAGGSPRSVGVSRVATVRSASHR